MDTQNTNICPYLLDNRNTNHILKPADNILLCDNFSCPYEHNFGRYLYEGEGKPIGICKSEGLIRKVAEESQLPTTI